MKFGLLRERKSKADARVALNPKQTRSLIDKGLDIVVESSSIRAFTDNEYKELGIRVVPHLDDRDFLLGVKEQPPEDILYDKTYMIFSHTIKKQPEGKPLFEALQNKNCTLIDYESIVNNQGRLVGFGHYAGIVGAYFALDAYGKSTNSFRLINPLEFDHEDQFYEELSKIDPSNLRVLLTGAGRVANGVKQVLHTIGCEQLGASEYLRNHLGFLQLPFEQYYTGPETHTFENVKDGRFRSNLPMFLPNTDLLIFGHYWEPGQPILLQSDDLDNTSVKVVQDITCDVDGSVKTTTELTTLENPFSEGAYINCAIDNLPTALPRMASTGFGKMMTENVFPNLGTHIIEDATLISKGKVSERFSYLREY